MKQLWNKLKYDNQRLDYYQPSYSSYNYLPASSINYPGSAISSLNNYNLMNNPLAESSNLHRTVVSLPTNSLPNAMNLQSNLQSSLQNNLQSSANNAASNLMTAESINNNQHLSAGVLPQQLTSIQHLSPEFLYDFGQKPNGMNGYPIDSLRNLQSINSGLSSLTSLTPLLLLSSLGTLSSKSLGHNGHLAPVTSTGFLKGLTAYLSSYLPSSPRQRKRQIDRNLPPYAFKKMAPIDPYASFQQLQPLGSQLKTTISNPSPSSSSPIYDASFSKKYSRFNKKKPVKYVKPKWINKKPYNLKKHKNQIKYSKLMNETGFVSRPNNITNEVRLNKSNKRTHNHYQQQHHHQQPQQIKYSEPDKYANTNEKSIDTKESNRENNQNLTKLTTTNREDDQSTNRSTDQNDKVNEKSNDKLNEKANEKLIEVSAVANEEGQNHSIELTSNQPQQTDNLEEFEKNEKMYR